MSWWWQTLISIGAAVLLAWIALLVALLAAKPEKGQLKEALGLLPDLLRPPRCMFASNFPVDGLYSTFGDLFAAFAQITAEFDRDERADLFAGTARRFYRLTE